MCNACDKNVEQRWFRCGTEDDDGKSGGDGAIVRTERGPVFSNRVNRRVLVLRHGRVLVLVRMLASSTMTWRSGSPARSRCRQGNAP